MPPPLLEPAQTPDTIGPNHSEREYVLTGKYANISGISEQWGVQGNGDNLTFVHLRGLANNPDPNEGQKVQLICKDQICTGTEYDSDLGHPELDTKNMIRISFGPNRDDFAETDTKCRKSKSGKTWSCYQPTEAEWIDKRLSENFQSFKYGQNLTVTYNTGFYNSNCISYGGFSQVGIGSKVAAQDGRIRILEGREEIGTVMMAQVVSNTDLDSAAKPKCYGLIPVRDLTSIDDSLNNPRATSLGLQKRVPTAGLVHAMPATYIAQ